MLVFWIVAIVLVLVMLGLLLPPLLRPNAVVRNDANAEKRAIFRQQFEELEQDKINGVLDASQYEVAKMELERRLLDEVGGEALASTGNGKPDRRLAFILLVLMPLFAVLLYLKLGSPISITIPAVAPDTSGSSELPAAEHSAMAGDIEPLLALLKKKLESKPNDGAGWALLARSYVEIRQHAEAVPAYEKAVKIIQDDPQLLADYADALAVVNGHKLEGKPEELVNQALKLDPHHPKALMLAATAAFDRKDYKHAITYWERLQQDLPADSELLPEVKASLDEAHALSGDNVSSSKIEPKPSVASVPGLSGMVRVAPALSSKLDPAATVFIFARATQGPPMPLAIVRTTVRELPYAYHLDDSSALMPSLKLSQASEVVLVARISKTGDAKAQSGDLQGISAAVKPNGVMDIEINQVVP
ncbi:formate-dependent nitrite reductase complex subunit NrfG [mine drainage metagenome]|uniref:Formate-dependent nitrite reductase complex subunit NrfG n=1 Tax=mine drainage metagenome TaxID=410659 RepID=A0A1J5SSQ3_9ZZZZ